MNSIRKKKGVSKFRISNNKFETLNNSFYDILAEDDENTFFEEIPAAKENYRSPKLENTIPSQSSFFYNFSNFHSENVFNDCSILSKKNSNNFPIISAPSQFISDLTDQKDNIKENNIKSTSEHLFDNNFSNELVNIQDDPGAVHTKEIKKSTLIIGQTQSFSKEKIKENIQITDFNNCQNKINNDSNISNEQPFLSNLEQFSRKEKTDLFLSESKILNSPELDTLTLSKDLINQPESLFLMFSQVSDKKAFNSSDFLEECTPYILGLPKWLKLNSYNSLDQWLCAFYESILIHQLN